MNRSIKRLKFQILTNMNDMDLTYPKVDEMHSRGECNITGRFLRQIVKGEREPGLKKLDAIADLFGVFTHTLICDSCTLSQTKFASDKHLNEIISKYLEADDEGKTRIIHAASKPRKQRKQK